MTDETLGKLWEKTPAQVVRDDLEVLVKKSRLDRGLWNAKKETAAKRKAVKKEKEDG